MKPSYSVWIVMRYESKCEADILGVFFNRDLAAKYVSEITNDNIGRGNMAIVIRAANAFDSGY